MTAALRGLFSPVPTPFGPDGAAAPVRLASQLEVYDGFDLAGYVVFGTSGEGPLLEDDEEVALLEAARRATDRPLIVQAGRESDRAAAKAAARATAAGADAILSLPPRYYPIDGEGLASHFRAVRNATDLPVLAYHIPQRTRVELSAELLTALAREGTIQGIKDSSGDLDLQATLRREAGAEFALLNGRASTAAAALAGGADGLILAVADGAPETAAELLAAHARGDRARSGELQRRLLPLGEAFGSRFGVPGIKAALDLRGWPGGGAPRAPLRPLHESARAEVADALREAGIRIP